MLINKPHVIIEHTFPGFKNHDDISYLKNAMEYEIQKSFGKCFNVEVKPGKIDNVIIDAKFNSPKERRAIRILAYKKLKQYK